MRNALVLSCWKQGRDEQRVGVSDELRTLLTRLSLPSLDLWTPGCGTLLDSACCSMLACLPEMNLVMRWPLRRQLQLCREADRLCQLFAGTGMSLSRWCGHLRRVVGR